VRLLKALEGKLSRDRQAKLPSPRRYLSGPARATSLKPVNSSAMSTSYEETGSAPIASMRRPRACTSPLLPSLVDDHQVWFDDPRFDGSFPSRVLPFLYLGNLCVSSSSSVFYFLTSDSTLQKSRFECLYASRSWSHARGFGWRMCAHSASN
jgi:dual specificity MAP kinase phosphatase